MNQIYDQPNQYDFGLDFDYAVWTADTVIDLINVPWNNDYRDIVSFADKNARDTWFNARATTGVKIEHLSYVKPNEPVRINIPFNKAIKFNYLRAQNPLQPVPDDELKTFFYFILDVRYVAPFTTELVLQLDVWQTYRFNVEFGNCFVERGHIGIANTSQFNSFGRDYLTVPEGLDVGGEYRNVARYEEFVMQANAHVIALSTTDLLADPGDEEDPKLKSASGGLVNNVPSGATYYAWESSSAFLNWLTSMQDFPWITQGIVVAMLVPNFSGWDASNKPSWTGNTPVKLSIGTMQKYASIKDNWRDDATIVNTIPNNYRHLKKLFTYPYMVVELTTWAATPVIIKPESWQTADADLQWMISLIIPGAKLAIMPSSYNASYEDDATTGERLNIATQLTNLPQIPIVNDMALSYLAANKHSIAFQRASADWSQQRALGSNQAQYDIATGAINATEQSNIISMAADSALTANANMAAQQSAMVNAIGSVAGGGASGAIMGPVGIGVGVGAGAVSAVANMVNTGIQVDANNQALATRNNAARAQTGVTNAQQGLVRDTNKSLSDWAAKGDYANAILGVNAKVQDAAMIQPSTSGQMGGEAFLMASGMSRISMTVKMMSPNVMDTVATVWLRYGYAINRFFNNLPSSMMVMDKFTYWKLKETYFKSANLPEGFKQAIRGVFEKGVTVWTNPDDIGNIDIADNVPLEGISY